MASLSLFPKFMDPLGGSGGGIGGGEIVVELVAEPEITLEPEVDIALEPDSIDIELEPELEIEVDA